LQTVQEAQKQGVKFSRRAQQFIDIIMATTSTKSIK